MTLPSILNIAREPEPADAVFVFAGREQRKRYGLELFHAGYAPALVLSVARFEWRRFRELGLPSDGGLVDAVQTIAARDRHFFVHVDGAGVRCERVPKGRLGTMTEARAIAAVVDRERWRSLLVVSSPEHLPRCMLALRAVVAPSCRITPVASGVSGDAIVPELVKLLGYGVMTMPRILRSSRRSL